MADIPPGVIPVSSAEYDWLHPIYEREARPGRTFQEWMRDRARDAAWERLKDYAP